MEKPKTPVQAHDTFDLNKPQILFPGSDLELVSVLKNDPSVEVHDSLLSQLEELVELRNPSKRFNLQELSKLASKLKEEQEQLHPWVYYSWRRKLVRMLRPDDFIEVRTNRNKLKINDEEQALLSGKKIGVVGLSVGRSVSTVLSMERSFGELRIADHDALDLSNLNRLKAPVFDLGEKKTNSMVRELYETDPYLDFTTFDEGISVDNIDAFFTEGGLLDLVVDECDSLEVKVLLREKAREYGVPLVMDTSDRGRLDIERHDLEHYPFFHNSVGEITSEMVQKMDAQEQMQTILDILNLEKISPRGKQSLAEIGKRLKTWPQLASDVWLGAGVAAQVIRGILLGNDVASGCHYLDVNAHLNNGEQG